MRRLYQRTFTPSPMKFVSPRSVMHAHKLHAYFVIICNSQLARTHQSSSSAENLHSSKLEASGGYVIGPRGHSALAAWPDAA